MVWLNWVMGERGCHFAGGLGFEPYLLRMLVTEVLQRRDQATRDVLNGVTLKSLTTDSTPPAEQLKASVTNILSK